MQVMKSYINGYYFHDYQRKKEITESKEAILNTLKDAYPNPLTVKDIADKLRMSENTVSQGLGGLYRHRFIEFAGKREGDKSKPPGQYVFEDLNFALNEKKNFAFQFAPGSVNYDKDFLEMCHEVLLRRDLETVCEQLLNFTTTMVERIMRQQHYIMSIKKIAPQTTKDNICTRCGINHEVRDFIRALLLYVLDNLEISPRFLSFMKEHYFIKEDTYKELSSLYEDKKRGELEKEKQPYTYLSKEKGFGPIEGKERRYLYLRVLSIEKDTELDKVFFTATDIQGNMVLGDIDRGVDIPDNLTSDTMIKCSPSDFFNVYMSRVDKLPPDPEVLGKRADGVSFNWRRVKFSPDTSYIEVTNDNKAFPTLSKLKTKIRNLEVEHYYVIDDVYVMRDPVTINVVDRTIPEEYGSNVWITFTVIGDETGVIPLIQEDEKKRFLPEPTEEGKLIPRIQEEKMGTNILNELRKGDLIRISGVETKFGFHVIPGLDNSPLRWMDDELGGTVRLYITKHSSIVKL